MDNPEMMFPGDLKHYQGYGYSRYRIENPEMFFEEPKTIALIELARGNPDMMITIYRAVPQNVEHIHQGDWVTPTRAYADIHNESNLDGRGRVVSRQVRAGDLHTEGNCIHEWGWNGG